jgi:hypothetical protein
MSADSFYISECQRSQRFQRSALNALNKTGRPLEHPDSQRLITLQN